MAEEVEVRTAGKTTFTECFKMIGKKPYILRLAFSAGLGGLVFGYDTGISGALLYIKEDFEEVEKDIWWQQSIVGSAVAGAIVGAGGGGCLNDKLGRKPSIIIADILVFVGAIITALSPAPWMIILGRVFVGLGIGLTSMTSPLYISETSPTKIRGALVSTYGVLITTGQFLSYLVNLGFMTVHWNWRWMLGSATVPALLQAILMLSLPESPRWLYTKDKVSDADAILAKIYQPWELEEELSTLRESIERTMAEERETQGQNKWNKIKNVCGNRVFRKGLYAGITCQVAQQFVGINSVMYYSPSIFQFAGFASKSTALALSLIMSGLNMVGSLFGMLFVDKLGRRRLMMISMIGIITSLIVLYVVFTHTTSHASKVSYTASTYFGVNSTCSSLLSARNPDVWNCMTCLRAASKCSFCAHGQNQLFAGACLARSDQMKEACKGNKRVYFTEGCPSKFGFLAVIFLGAYIVSFTPGMGTVPWIVNSEIYPLKYRGLGGGIAAMSNWTSNLIVTETFLTLTLALGSGGTFLLFAGFAAVGLVFIFMLVPETKGMPIEEVEDMLDKGFKRGF